jgi:hypothetical protein
MIIFTNSRHILVAHNHEVSFLKKRIPYATYLIGCLLTLAFSCVLLYNSAATFRQTIAYLTYILQLLQIILFSCTSLSQGRETTKPGWLTP